MKYVFETRIITLEKLYYKISKKEDKYYVQLIDENVNLYVLGHPISILIILSYPLLISTLFILDKFLQSI